MTLTSHVIKKINWIAWFVNDLLNSEEVKEK